MSTPESLVKAKVKAALKTLPAVFQHWPVMNGMGAPILDCIACVNGRYIAIECKAKGKHPTPRQHMLIQQILEAGGRAFVVDDEQSLNEVMDWIKKSCL